MPVKKGQKVKVIRQIIVEGVHTPVNTMLEVGKDIKLDDANYGINAHSLTEDLKAEVPQKSEKPAKPAPAK